MPKRIEVARAFAQEQIQRDPGITGIIVVGSTVRNDAVEASDIDLRLVAASSADNDDEREDVRTWRDGVLIDVEYSRAADCDDIDQLLRDPYLAGPDPRCRYPV